MNLYPMGGDTNVSWKEKIQAIDWRYLQAVNIDKVKETSKPIYVLWRLKQRVSFDMLEYFAKVDLSAMELFKQTYCLNYQLCKSYGILDWFARKMAYWQKQQDYHLALIQERAIAVMRSRYDLRLDY